MRNVITAVVSLVVAIPVVVWLGYHFVPDVQDAESPAFSRDFWFSSYFTLLGFLATSAVIGPLTAQFIQWRADSEWKDARLNARDRLAHSLRELLSQFRAFVVLAARDERGWDLHMMDNMIKELERFFQIYDDEHATFNAGMHRAASNLRKVLLPLHAILRTTHLFAERRQSVRIYMHRHSLDVLRALFDKPRLGRAAAATPLDRAPYFHPEEPVVIESDPSFFETDRLFIDASVDRHLGAGSVAVHAKFAGLDVAALLAEWGAFVAACPRGAAPPSVRLDSEIGIVQQKVSYGRFVRRHIEDKHLRDMLIDRPAEPEVATAEGRGDS